MINILKQIAKLLDSYKLEWWFCGSTVRNFLFKKPITKYNVAVNLNIKNLQEIFNNKIKKINKYQFSVEIVHKNLVINLFPYKITKLNNTFPYYYFSNNIVDDALSRDFCVNAVYYNTTKKQILDPLKIRNYLINKELKIIGNPEEKILESKIILLRAATLCARLGEGWKLNKDDIEIIKKEKLKIKSINRQQIYKELYKLFYEAEKPSIAFNILKETELLEEIFPELNRCVGIPQSNKSKNLDLYQHIMLAIDSIPPFQPNSVLLRIAALLHDIGKPYTQTNIENKMHFYGHEIVGANIAEEILFRWGFNYKFVEKVTILIKNHLFDAYTKSLKNIKKLILKVGPENIHNLLDLRIADRVGSGKKNISMEKIEILRFRINKVLEFISPQNIRLDLSNLEIIKIINNEDNKLIEEIKNYLLNQITINNLKNKKSILEKEIIKINTINCPLGKSYLFQTWSKIVTNEAETFQNGNLKCGIFCNFLCNSVINKK